MCRYAVFKVRPPRGRIRGGSSQKAPGNARTKSGPCGSLKAEQHVSRVRIRSDDEPIRLRSETLRVGDIEKARVSTLF